METYRHLMFKGGLRGFIVKQKGIFMKAIIAYAKMIPEPTRDDTFLPNIGVLFDLRDEFLEHANIPSRIELIKALFKIGISEYAHDTVYQFFIDWLLYRLRKVEWILPVKWESTYWKTLVGAKEGKHG